MGLARLNLRVCGNRLVRLTPHPPVRFHCTGWNFNFSCILVSQNHRTSWIVAFQKNIPWYFWGPHQGTFISSHYLKDQTYYDCLILITNRYWRHFHRRARPPHHRRQLTKRIQRPNLETSACPSIDRIQTFSSCICITHLSLRPFAIRKKNA